MYTYMHVQVHVHVASTPSLIYHVVYMYVQYICIRACDLFDQLSALILTQSVTHYFESSLFMPIITFDYIIIK